MKDFLLQPFALGFYTGCILLLLALYHLFQLKREHARYRRMLSDKMEIDAGMASKQKNEIDGLKKENENLRVKVQALSVQPEHKLARELEIYARAEKRMMIAAPGFAGPWEQAKQAAHQDVSEEDTGKAAPRTLFQRFFGGQSSGGEQPKSLPSGPEASTANAQAG